MSAWIHEQLWSALTCTASDCADTVIIKAVKPRLSRATVLREENWQMGTQHHRYCVCKKPGKTRESLYICEVRSTDEAIGLL